MTMPLDLISVFLPLAGAAIAGFGNRALGDRAAQIVTCVCVLAAAVASIILFQQVALGHTVIDRTL